MQTTASVIVALFLGALFVVIVGGMALLVFLHLRLQKMAKELSEMMGNFVPQLKSSTEASQKELNRILEGARSNFSGVRADVSKALETQMKSVSKAMKEQEQVFAEKVGNINGEVLQAASIRALRACQDLSALTVTLKNLLVSHEVSQPGAELGSEEYGPSDTIYAMQSATDRADAAVIREEVEELSPRFSMGMTE